MNTIQKNKSNNISHFLQRQILLSFLLFIAIAGTFLAVLSSYLYKQYLQRALFQTAEFNLQLLVNDIDKNIENIKFLMGFCQTNTVIGEFVENGRQTSPAFARRSHSLLEETVSSNASHEYIHRIIVSSDNGGYLQVVSSTYSNASNSAEIIENMPYYEKMASREDYSFFTGFQRDPLYHGTTRTSILPLLHPITLHYGEPSDGWIMIMIDEQLFTDPLSYYSLADDSSLYLTLDSHTYRLTSDGCEELPSEDQPESKEINTSFLTPGTKACIVRSGSFPDKTMYLSKPFDNLENCYISQSISAKELNSQKTLVLFAVAGIILLLCSSGLILSGFLYRKIGYPVLQLRSKVDRIANGDFSPDPSIEWNHELGDIGRGINQMSENIVELMNHQIENEKQRYTLEYKMLQSQIHPHFIYNTLNSIIWMADLQGADGIVEITTAFSKLLKSISKSTASLVTIHEELAILKEYFTIQQYRYGGTITLDIDVREEALYDCKIIKFSLQPLVENAIFHGIEPKGCIGTITITVESVPNQLLLQASPSDDAPAVPEIIRITVEDNGVGIASRKASELLTENSRQRTDFFQEIGINSVHKRLQYEFGAPYGIHIESEEGSYTRIILLFPKKY